MPKKPSEWLKALALIAIIALVLVGVIYRQAISDYIKLATYTPPADISQLATDDTMTASAQHLFYINQPKLEDKASFRQDCPNGTEQTVVLGCYKGGESGIYLLAISDPRLSGVEQVTAAHETLHAAYERLNPATKKQVDGWLMAYYKTVKDPQLIETFNNYKKTEPGQLLNEMHSIFGTEVANLPANLENYYKRYFTDRSKVTDYYASYQEAFNSLQQQIASIKAQLDQLKASIASNEAITGAESTSLEQQRTQINNYRGNPNTYNSEVESYNASVDQYNALVGQLKSEIASYNQLVQQYNQIAISINALGNELNANVQTARPASR